jgi:hypothetical protein
MPVGRRIVKSMDATTMWTFLSIWHIDPEKAIDPEGEGL